MKIKQQKKGGNKCIYFKHQRIANFLYNKIKN